MNSFYRYVLPGLVAVFAAIALYLQSQGQGGYALMAWIGAGSALCAAVIARSTRLGVLLTAIGAFASNAYLLQRSFSQLQAGPDALIAGNTGLLQLDPALRLKREATAAQFDRGKVRRQ